MVAMGETGRLETTEHDPARQPGIDDPFERTNARLLDLASHRRIPMDLIRIYLGIALLVKGVQFFRDPAFVRQALTQDGILGSAPDIIVYYITLAHVVGGLLLALGLWTRVAALVQIPVLFGAAFLVHLPEGTLTYTHRFEFTALVLFLLVLLLVHGGGRISLDHRLRARSRR